METEPGNGSILKNLAHDMLSGDENAQFKDALQRYRQSASLTSLVSQLTKVIKGTEKLMLLVELSNALPKHLRKDFQKLCCLHFPEYESFLTYFTPGTVGERSRIITQDPTGQFQVVSSGADDKAHFNFHKSDQTSLPGESGIDVNSDIDDICRHSDHNNNANSLGPTWRIESRSNRSNSTSSHVSISTNRAPTPKNSLSGSQQLQQSWKSGSQDNKNQIRNRARSLRVLSGSLPSVVAPLDNSESRSEGKARILLKRHEDGSLGIGIKGGKEYGAPIVVYLVDPGSQAAAQGLQVGDQILDVNGTDFSNITHSEAVTMMRNAWNIIMVVQRPEEKDGGGKGSTSSKGRGSLARSRQSEFDSVMSLDLCPLGLGDEDIVSSTPRRPTGRSHSEDGRHLIAQHYSQQHQFKYHCHQQQPNDYRIQQSKALVSDPKEQEEEEEPSMELITHTVKVDVHCSKSPREDTCDNSNVIRKNKEDSIDAIDALDRNDLGELENQRKVGDSRETEQNHNRSKHKNISKVEGEDNPWDWDHSSELTPAPQHSPGTEYHASHVRRHHSQPRPQASVYPYSQPSADVAHHHQKHQPRIYRPRIVQHASQQVVSFHPRRPLARYISSGHNQPTPSALPSRAAMVYSPTPFINATELERGRSRTKKKSSTQGTSAASKMRQLRNRSQSPHAVHLHNNQSRDREFLRAIQNSVERRQRAHRLSLYQLPDQDDDAWNIG
ncbi:whirlin [Elysia marginata]|uniref:Whirlin n=1 Tax=Elysia marginata TaxID=1093978 RepID=A0AAV4F081_9GAST|nr:whirlin [Elysia marginata]